ncbi:MAG: hypothetical protein AAF960_29130, partial [Bacteroidota bacterium]
CIASNNIKMNLFLVIFLAVFTLRRYDYFKFVVKENDKNKFTFRRAIGYINDAVKVLQLIARFKKM